LIVEQECAEVSAKLDVTIEVLSSTEALGQAGVVVCIMPKAVGMPAWQQLRVLVPAAYPAKPFQLLYTPPQQDVRLAGDAFAELQALVEEAPVTSLLGLAQHWLQAVHAAFQALQLEQQHFELAELRDWPGA
jgi:hypothetical protein